MLVIRQKQWDAMQESMHLAFEDRCITELRASYPKRLKKVEDEDLREDVRVGIRRAEEFGITDDTFVINFLGFLVEYGRDFAETEETVWAREILENDYYTEEDKLQELSRRRTLEIFKI